MSKRLNPAAQAAYDRAIDRRVDERLKNYRSTYLLGLVMSTIVFFMLGAIFPYLYRAFVPPPVDTPLFVLTGNKNWHQAYLNDKGEWIEMCDGHKMKGVQEWIKP